MIGLLEAAARGLYEGPVPTWEQASDFYSVARMSDRVRLSLFAPALKLGRVDELAGLYMEFNSIFNGEPVPDKAEALQWVSLTQWLAEYHPEISSLNTVDDALDFINKCQKYGVDSFSAVKRIRDIRHDTAWVVNTKNTTGAKAVYTELLDEIQKKSPPNRLW